MDEMEKNSEMEGGVILMDDAKTYRNFVLSIENRPYDVVVLFNLMPDMAAERCVPHCGIAE